MVDSIKKQKGTKPRPKRPQFEEVLGTFCNVKAYSCVGVDKLLPDFNFQRYQTDPEYNTFVQKLFANYVDPQQTQLKEPIYSGAKYQCVEYARRFMIINQNATFNDIDYAYNIFDMPFVQDIYDSTLKLPFIAIKNGELEQPPQPGDYVINGKSDNQLVGHISVVKGSNTEGSLYYDIVEQNYDKRFWPSPNYSRRLIMELKNGKYYLTNKNISKKYPKILEHTDSEDSDEENIIGIKRVDRPIKYLNSNEKTNLSN